MDEHEATVRADDAAPSTGGRVADLLRENAALRAEREAILGLSIKPVWIGPNPCWRVHLDDWPIFPTWDEAVAEVLRLAAVGRAAGESAKGGDADGRE